MDDRYEASEFDCDQLLDELMCEYIDGTMDPCVRSAFEELVHANPAIAEQLDGLAHARQLLTCSRCQMQAPRQFQTRLRARLNAETGKIDVYGIQAADTQSASFPRYLFLAIIFVWSGVLLPRHDMTPGNVAEPALAETSPARSLPPLRMTPATRSASTILSEPYHAQIAPLTFNRSNPPVRIPTAEAELTLLAD